MNNSTKQYKKHGYNILQIRNETLIAFINNEIDNIKKRVAPIGLPSFICMSLPVRLHRKSILSQ